MYRSERGERRPASGPLNGKSFRFVRAGGRGEAACGREGHEFQMLVAKMKSFPPALLLLLLLLAGNELCKYPGFS